MGIILNIALPFFTLILLGAIAARVFKHNERGLDWLNTFVFYFALPPLIFQTVARADPGQLSNFAFVAGTTLSTYIVFIAVFAAAIFFLRVGFATAAIQASAGSYGNVGYMGVPITVAALGQDVALAATLILVFDNLVQFTLVPLLSALDAESDRDWVASAVGALKRLAQHPLMIAAVLGGMFSAFSLELPQSPAALVELLAEAAAPCALFAIGITVSQRPFRGFGREFPLIVLSKMLLHPLVVLLVLGTMGGFDPLWVSAAILMASLPTAANVYVLAVQSDTYVDGASNAILVTTAISVVTVSFLLYLIDRQALPVSLF